MGRERITSIKLPGLVGVGSSLSEYGHLSAAEMIAKLRELAARQKANAEAILAAADEDFHIRTYWGVHAQCDVKVIQEGKKP